MNEIVSAYIIGVAIVLTYVLYILFALTYEAERPPSQGWEDEEIT